MPGIPSEDDNCNLTDLTNTSYVKEIRDQKGNAINYLAFIVPIVHVCAKKQGAVKPRDSTGEKQKGPAKLIVVIGSNTQCLLPLPRQLPYPPEYHLIF